MSEVQATSDHAEVTLHWLYKNEIQFRETPRKIIQIENLFFITFSTSRQKVKTFGTIHAMITLVLPTLLYRHYY